jgi:hypothetical protein
MTALWLIIALLAEVSATAVVLAYLRQSRVRRLAEIPMHAVKVWPRVSVIMAARDEVDRIGPALASRLADEYPELELVLVDDRSTDGTGEVAHWVAGQDPRFRLVRVDSLPPRWLGKVHALNEGVKAASGDYLLFSDADVSVKPGAVRRAVALCEREAIDCLALVPEYRSTSVLVDACWVVFLRAMSLALDYSKVPDPEYPKSVLGSGAFTLVRREAYERTPGFEHLRMESADDMALASMIKQAGGRCDGVVGTGCASVQMYDSPSGFLRGIEKNGSTTASSPWTSSAGVLAFALLDLMPLVAVAAGPAWLRAIGLATALVAWIGNVGVLRATCSIWAPALLWPLGTVLFTFGMLRSTLLAVVRGGVRWRGTFYSLAELEAGRRFTL